jgi:hypothetical protein
MDKRTTDPCVDHVADRGDEDDGDFGNEDDWFGSIHYEHAELHKARIERIGKYQSSSLRQKVDLDSCLSALCGGAMAMASLQEKQLVAEFTDPTQSSPRRFNPGGMDTYLRLARQIDRFLQVGLRIRESRKRWRLSQRFGGNGELISSTLSPK